MAVEGMPGWLERGGAVRLSTSSIVSRWSGMRKHGQQQMSADAESMRTPRWQLLLCTWLDPSSPLSTCRYCCRHLARSIYLLLGFGGSYLPV